MRTIDWVVESATERFSVSGEIEVEGNATNEEIEAEVSDQVFNIINWGWSERGK